LVPKSPDNQTESLLAVLVSEFARNMNTSTLQKTFVNPIKIDQIASQETPWKPTQLIIDTPEEYLEEPKQASQKKRNSTKVYYVRNDIPKATNEEEMANKRSWTNKDNTTSLSPNAGKEESYIIPTVIDPSTDNGNNDTIRTEMENFCRHFINTSTNELKIRIEKNATDIERIHSESKNSIGNLESKMIQLQEENNERAKQQQHENKTAMDNILQNQELMLKHLMGSNTHRNQHTTQAADNYSTYASNDECKWDDYQHDQSHNNNNKPNRTATPFGTNHSCDDNKTSAAGKQ
jgi:hypothetical protein